MRGPKAFLVSVGTVLVFMGALVLSAVPAARHMDAAEDREEGGRAEARSDGIVVGAGTLLVAGAGLVVWGLVLRPVKPPGSRGP